jgi:NAD(P)-dependent dehydrogenase (short-subunit alcohol dehydrogenase family)
MVTEGVDVKEFSGKVAFITGGASGIGFAMARRFGERGMKLVLADVEKSALEKAVAELASGGIEVTGVACDVSDPASVTTAADRAEEAYGLVHVLCNNAGVSPTCNLDESTVEDWRWVVGVNLMGVVHGIQTLVPRMKAHGEGGHVVNTASIAGLVALPSLGIYTATKYAVVGISETLRAELAPFGIGVSVLCPSFVKTRLADSERNRPEGLGAPGDPNAFIVEALKGGMDAGEVGAAVVAAIERDELYVLTHADSKIGFQMRADAILQAFPDA